MSSSQSHIGALMKRAGIPATLTTAQAAAAHNRKPQTLNKSGFLNSGPV